MSGLLPDLSFPVREPSIIIGGAQLTEAQAMAVRVAVSSFQLEMADPDALGDDETGRTLVKAYRARLAEIMPMLVTE